jgi:hypothetical protein
MENNDLAVLNPDIQEVVIGIRKLRKIKIYPLSVIDQFKVTDMFTEAMGLFLANKVPTDTQLISLLIAVLKTNLAKVLRFVLDEEEDTEIILSELTNNQFTVIATLIYEMNYAIISKNVSSLLKKVSQTTQKESPSVRPLPQSAVSMDTNLTTSSENPGEMVD